MCHKVTLFFANMKVNSKKILTFALRIGVSGQRLEVRKLSNHININVKMKRLYFLAALLLTAFAAQAQQAIFEKHDTRSPQFNDDGTVKEDFPFIVEIVTTCRGMLLRCSRQN